MRLAVLLPLLALAGTACSPSVLPSQTLVGPSAPGTAATAVTVPSGVASPAPAPSTGFTFDAESIVGYYETLGYACSDLQPSTKAAGYSFRSCQLVDTDGRTRVVGIVTDEADDVADAYASLAATGTETILDPAVALEPFAAFMGAMLGESQGESLLPWLAGHLGDSYTTTTIADLTVATYTATPEDHSKLYVEIGNAAYLEAPGPGASP